MSANLPDRPLLAIDTSTPVGSVAVGTAHNLLAHAVVGVNARHSEALLPVIDFVLARAAIAPRDLAGIVVAGGPGSFTGVRIAAAAAKGFARALDLPLYARSGLLANAAAAGAGETPVCALFDARREQVYAACYSFPGFERIEQQLPPSALALDDVIAALAHLQPLYVGEGARKHAAALRAAGARVAPAHVGADRAAALIWLQSLDAESARVQDIADWEPDYLRASGAERSLAP